MFETKNILGRWVAAKGKIEFIYNVAILLLGIYSKGLTTGPQVLKQQCSQKYY